MQNLNHKKYILSLQSNSGNVAQTEHIKMATLKTLFMVMRVDMGQSQEKQTPKKVVASQIPNPFCKFIFPRYDTPDHKSSSLIYLFGPPCLAVDLLIKRHLNKNMGKGSFSSFCGRKWNWPKLNPFLHTPTSFFWVCLILALAMPYLSLLKRFQIKRQKKVLVLEDVWQPFWAEMATSAAAAATPEIEGD